GGLRYALALECRGLRIVLHHSRRRWRVLHAPAARRYAGAEPQLRAGEEPRAAEPEAPRGPPCRRRRLVALTKAARLPRRLGGVLGGCGEGQRRRGAPRRARAGRTPARTL